MRLRIHIQDYASKTHRILHNGHRMFTLFIYVNVIIIGISAF